MLLLLSIQSTAAFLTTVILLLFYCIAKTWFALKRSIHIIKLFYQCISVKERLNIFQSGWPRYGNVFCCWEMAPLKSDGTLPVVSNSGVLHRSHWFLLLTFTIITVYCSDMEVNGKNRGTTDFQNSQFASGSWVAITFSDWARFIGVCNRISKNSISSMQVCALLKCFNDMTFTWAPSIMMDQSDRNRCHIYDLLYLLRFLSHVVIEEKCTNVIPIKSQL